MKRTDAKFLFEARYRVVWLALGLLFVLVTITESTELSAPSIKLVTALAGVLALAAAGQAIVIMSGGIDLSVPSVMGLGAAIVVRQTNGADDQLTMAIVEALVVAAAVGLANGLLVTLAKLNAFIVTLAMNGIVFGAILIWTKEGVLSTNGRVPGALEHFSIGKVGLVSNLGLLGLGVLAFLAFMLRSTSGGRSFVTMGSSRRAAEIIGVRIRSYEIGGYVVAALLYASAGILLGGFIGSPNIALGQPYMLTTIVAVALGGAALGGGPSSMFCTGAACLFLTTLNQYLALKSFSSGISYLANGVALALGVAIVTIGSGGGTRLRALFQLSSRRAAE